MNFFLGVLSHSYRGLFVLVMAEVRYLERRVYHENKGVRLVVRFRTGRSL